MLPLFAPWALLPWDVAWFVWRGGAILLLFWTIHWAYRRKPLPTAVAILLLAFPIAANLDTGNITLMLTFMLWAARFVGPARPGFLWGLATWMKWVPAPVLAHPRPAGPGLGHRLAARRRAVLSLVMLPLTIVQLQAMFGFGTRPIRLDYLVLLWATVPWLWQATTRSAGSDRRPGAPCVAELADRAPADGAVPEVRRPRGALDRSAAAVRDRRRVGDARGRRRDAARDILAAALVDLGQQQRADDVVASRRRRTPAAGRAPSPNGAGCRRRRGRAPIAAAIAPDEPVTTLLIPMYRPDSAFGMMSVMSAQSTARKIPDATPTGTAKPSARPVDGDDHEHGHPDEPDDAPRRRSSASGRPGRDIRPDGHGGERAEDDDQDAGDEGQVERALASAQPERVLHVEEGDRDQRSCRSSGRTGASRGARRSSARARMSVPQAPRATCEPRAIPGAGCPGAPRGRGTTVSSIVMSSTAMITKTT